MSAVTLSNCTETLCYVNSQVKRLIELFHLTIFEKYKITHKEPAWEILVDLIL